MDNGDIQDFLGDGYAHAVANFDEFDFKLYGQGCRGIAKGYTYDYGYNTGLVGYGFADRSGSNGEYFRVSVVFVDSGLW